MRQHPEHCAAAVEVMREAVNQGIVPADIDPKTLDEVLHRTQIGLYVAGLCAAP
ncbi:MAG: hypothetical protein M3Q08_03640 [Pseudomonadota bacterium]|nr:hypothetical protein [Pseudomonadota bacterium]